MPEISTGHLLIFLLWTEWHRVIGKGFDPHHKSKSR